MEVLQHSRFSGVGDCRKVREEFRLEEGLIRAFHTDDHAVSPSYVDEKIRKVLEYFGKDFEGKSSKEKLGPMFGGYGSFLPTDERNLGPGKNVQLEEGGDSRVSTNTVKHSSSTVPSVHGSINKDVNGTCADPQQKVRLKVRIKMGSIDFSAKNFSEIYNGLNLHISSPSSLEDSPMEADVSLTDIPMGSEVTNENRSVSSKPLSDNKNGKSPTPDALSQEVPVSNPLRPTKGVHAVNLAYRPMSRSNPLNMKKKKPIHSMVEKDKETKKEESNLNEHEVRMKNKRKNARDNFEPSKKTKKEGTQKDASTEAATNVVREATKIKYLADRLKKSVSNRESTELYKRKNSRDNFEPSKKTKKEGTQKDSSTEAATNVVREATKIKYLADRLKKSVSNRESTELYLQAVLKFLHGASLYESCNGDGAIQIYRSTAKLCEFCARKYEKFEDMGGAALAYKCMEVAYMRVVYASLSSAVKDHHELRVSIKRAPLDKSTLFRKSGAGNLNNVARKVLNDKGSITSRDLPSFQRTLNHVQDTIFAMEASKKSRIAFAATKLSIERTKQKDSISSIRKVLDFSFHNVEGFIHLVRVAMEATPSV